ncbi:MAG: hypothetical protein FJY92_09515, partial [Candidatus Hydrogenedentes bacterium]|nr:hypothetical protein [Candidatus Hydrogenedentota bacterium]
AVTLFLIDVSDYVRFKYPTIILTVCAGLIVLKLLLRIAGGQRIHGRHASSSRFPRIPFIGAVFAINDLISVCGVLERLAAANVPINEALRDCASLDLPGAMRRALFRATARVEQGETLGNALRDARVFPDSFVTMLALGEASGRLDGAARHLRTMYEQQILSALRIGLDIAGPIGVLGLGAVTLTIYGGMFRALIAITQAMLATM